MSEAFHAFSSEITFVSFALSSVCLLIEEGNTPQKGIDSSVWKSGIGIVTFFYGNKFSLFVTQNATYKSECFLIEGNCLFAGFLKMCCLYFLESPTIPCALLRFLSGVCPPSISATSCSVCGPIFSASFLIKFGVVSL